MITRKFRLTEGNAPPRDQWYLGVYIDAFERMEMPNTRGMNQFVDGGYVATKPYVSSANYINKMGYYCKSCPYNPKKTTGENACPFNSLFWCFVEPNKALFSKNMRTNFMVKNREKRDETTRRAMLEQAAYYKKHVESL